MRYTETRITRNPPATPPRLHCLTPRCRKAFLQYVKSFISGVGGPDQWDRFICTICQLEYEYRQRTRKLRVVNPTEA